MKKIMRKFWAWYEKFYGWNLFATAALFALQLAHLYWLTTHVALYRILGTDFFFTHSPIVTFFIILADYTEIPALLATTILYARLYKKEGSKKHLLYILLINSQWIHLFWLTDEVALNAFGMGGYSVAINPVVAWAAILIDYLELPIIFDTIREVFRARSLTTALEVIKAKE